MIVYVSTIAGKPGECGNIDGRGEGARFYTSLGISFDSQRNLFIADTGNNSIRKLSSDGRVSTVIERGTLNFPSSVRSSSDGTLFIADTHNQVIRRVSIDGTRSIIAGSAGVSGDADGPSDRALFYFPIDILLHPDGGMLVADYNKKIKGISPDGLVSTIVKTEVYPQGLCLVGDGKIFVFSSQYPSFTRIERITLNGEITLLASNETPLTHPLKGVRCGAFLPNGELVFTDFESHTVRILRKDGKIEILAGQYDVIGHRDGDAKNESLFYFPYGIGVDEKGDIYVADSSNHCIRKISFINWTRENHDKFPLSFRSQVRTLMTLWMIRESIIHWLPRDILFYLFTLME